MEIERPDYIFHLGDYMQDAEKLERLYPMLPMVRVPGNCDYDFVTPDRQIGEWGGVRFLLTHGHRYGVKQGLLCLSMAAKEAQADVALFGHTHRAFCEQHEGIWLMNPGSCGGAWPSYGVVEIQDKHLDLQIHTFE